MAITKRPGTFFLSGFLLGAAAVAGAWRKGAPASSIGPDKPEAVVPPFRPLPAAAQTSVPPQRHLRNTSEERGQQPRVTPAYGGAVPPNPTVPDTAATRVFPSQLQQARQRAFEAPPTGDAVRQTAVEGQKHLTQKPRSTPTPREAGSPPFRPLPDYERTEIPPPPGGHEGYKPDAAVRNPIPSARKLAIYASGFVIGAALVVGSWLALDSNLWPSPTKSKSGIVASQSGTPASSSRQAAACSVQPATAAANEKDGRFPLQADVSGLIAADMASFIVLGREAAAAGRPRDAEVAFLMSCRVAEKLKGADSVESADAKYQLAAHYARLAVASGPAAGADRPELLKRAERLYSESSQAYAVKYGQANEKSRFAAEGLASARQTLAQVNAGQFNPLPSTTAPTALAPQVIASQQLQPQLSEPPATGVGEPVRPGLQASASPMPEPFAMARPQPVPVEITKILPNMPRAAGTRAGPSFDCSHARSWSERTICSDAELSRLDLELGRVYAQARKSTRDRAAFRREQDQEWRRREATCRDRDCLVRWYVQRHQQLTNYLDGRRQTQSAGMRWGQLQLPSWGPPSVQPDRFYRGN
jgi:hypothetical protein